MTKETNDTRARKFLDDQPTSPSVAFAFDTARAEAYDRQFESIRAITGALHLLMRMHFAGLPSDARILVVGAGTGAEVRFLAPLFPGWRFTLVDPSEAMLSVARRHAEAEGFLDRCTFHADLLPSLPPTPHHAATSLMVSHFLLHREERQAFFEAIAARLLPGGLLVTADIAADPTAPTFDAVMDLWIDLLVHADTLSPDGRATYRAAFGTNFAAHPPAEVEALIHRAGFAPPTPSYQAALLRAWTTTRLPA
ncbi:MAG: class I SAM-dependent methyltransferase [Polyangiales bacterium]